MLARSFAEARRVVRDDGVVTIVFGHGDPEVWHRLLGAITAGGLYLTGSWPAKTEAGGKAGSANIVTTLTLSCRPGSREPPDRSRRRRRRRGAPRGARSRPGVGEGQPCPDRPAHGVRRALHGSRRTLLRGP